MCDVATLMGVPRENIKIRHLCLFNHNNSNCNEQYIENSYMFLVHFHKKILISEDTPNFPRVGVFYRNLATQHYLLDTLVTNLNQNTLLYIICNSAVTTILTEKRANCPPNLTTLQTFLCYKMLQCA